MVRSETSPRAGHDLYLRVLFVGRDVVEVASHHLPRRLNGVPASASGRASADLSEGAVMKRIVLATTMAIVALALGGTAGATVSFDPLAGMLL